jgi:methionyl-tRNA formyltransferase
MIFEKKSEPRIVYMGTPEISAPILEALVTNGFNVAALITNEDKAVGRKAILEPTPTKKVALKYGIPVYQPHRIRLDYQWLSDLKPDVIVCMAYGQLVPTEVLNMPKYGCINLHGSLLPKLRGAAPIQRAIMEGDRLSGVTLMQMVDKMDAGLMYDKVEVTIDPQDNYTKLAQKISDAGKALILKDLMPYLNGELPGVPQDESAVTIAHIIKPENEKIPLDLSAQDLVNYVRGLSETPGAYLMLGNLKLKIYGAHVVNSEVKSPLGQIVLADKTLVFQAKDGQVQIDDLQLEGKKKMDARSFLNGAHGLLGETLS